MNDYFAELVSHRTVSTDVAANNTSLKYIESFLRGAGLHITHYQTNGVDSLVATTQPRTKTPKVMLSAHLDVVPGTDEQFTLTEKDGKLFGRGTADMKFAIASYMHVVDSLKGHLDEYDFAIMITADEEVGGSSFAEIVKDGWRPTVCLLPDGAENWEIETLAKGLLWEQLTVHGAASHGSRPWEGDSASLRMVSALHEIMQDFTEQAPMSDTLNIGTIRAGETVNQVPALAQADLDIRYLSQESLEKTKVILDTVCKKYGVEHETKLLGLPCVNDIANPYITTWKRCLEDLIGVSPQGIVAYGGSDARHLAPLGVPCIISEPYAGDRHGPAEWIEKKGYEQYREVILDYLQKVGRA